MSAEQLPNTNVEIHNLISEKEREYEQREQLDSTNWGSRGEILTIGKPIAHMLFHRGQKITSARKQVQLLYNWFLQCEDRRTRVIGKAWFEKRAGLFDQIYDHPFFADFFSDHVVGSDTEFIYHQRFYTYQRALKIMKRITEDRESQYILTNPVYAMPHEIPNDYGKRTISRLTEMHVLYAELDHYKIEKWESKSSKQIWKVVKKHLIEVGFPLPTEVVFSRGLHLYWKHAPIPAFMIDEWRLLMKHVHELLTDFGADVRALDPVRILRAVGSIHEKTGEKITGITFTNDRYDFMELFNTFCYEQWTQHLLKQAQERQKRVQALEKRWNEKQKWMMENGIIDENGDFTEKYEPNKKGKRKRINADVKKHRYNTRHQNIVDGVFWLSDHVRKGKMEGFREFACYLVRTMTLRITGGNTIEALRVTQELYDGFSPQRYSWSDIVERTKSAEIDYKRWVMNETLGVRYSTEKLIDEFKIKPDEMKQMRFIVDGERYAELKAEYNRFYKEQTDYNRKYYEKQLEKKGKMTNEEKKKHRVNLIKEHLNVNPKATQKELAALLGVSDRTIRSLKKEFGI